MARGDMKVDTLAVSREIEILNRKEFEAVAMTVDFTGINTKADNGDYIVKAGTPVDEDGAPVTTTPWSGAVGILLHDAYSSRPQVAVLKTGYVHTGRAQTNSGLTYNAALVTALNGAGCRIAFEEPIISTAYNPTST